MDCWFIRQPKSGGRAYDIGANSYREESHGYLDVGEWQMY
jgi:hypothetical protein